MTLPPVTTLYPEIHRWADGAPRLWLTPNLANPPRWTIATGRTRGVGRRAFHLVAFLDAAREGFRWLTFVPERSTFERLDRSSVVEMDHRIKLLAETSVEVVASALGLGSIDHADRPLQTWDSQGIVHRGLRRVQPEALRSTPVEERLVTVGRGSSNPLALGRTAPVGGRGDRAVEGGEPHQHALVAVALAGELPDVELASGAHLGGPCVAHMRVVLPHDDLRSWKLVV